ncbi:uncharacterized protein BO80DRAFT_200247 [Aspergillus ibericus CBS 121593]|uniref:Uncharacterized protein n=1 Tax=Aspergillus ibericus CBS 121593 TaxID=1448316 RepID=A0A395GNR7_9EURO|nr:hypothetical protein BO80DRAFT_200247 [Aspergillus ibericus CBS 121593]RAK97024.1 hypothetical protein BO80DRAFT_200247 [Aspergillus ibericus CBS 121593]
MRRRWRGCFVLWSGGHWLHWLPLHSTTVTFYLCAYSVYLVFSIIGQSFNAGIDWTSKMNKSISRIGWRDSIKNLIDQRDKEIDKRRKMLAKKTNSKDAIAHYPNSVQTRYSAYFNSLSS